VTDTAPPLGLNAGNGRFPFLVAAAARRGGRRVVCVAIEEEAAPELADEVDAIHWMSLGQLGRAIAAFKDAGVSEAVMAGQVKHRQIFSGIMPDLKLMGVLARLAVKSTDSLIGGVADVLEGEGIRLLSSTELLTDEMASVGAMTRRSPDKGERRDIEYGIRIAHALGELDLGQTVVVKDGAAVALEAMEGTDEVIRRAGSIAGEGTVVVKVAKPRQDMRFDVPVVGEGTLAAMAEARARVLAIEAQRTLFIDREAVLAAANRGEIAVWGFEHE